MELTNCFILFVLSFVTIAEESDLKRRVLFRTDFQCTNDSDACVFVAFVFEQGRHREKKNGVVHNQMECTRAGVKCGLAYMVDHLA